MTGLETQAKRRRDSPDYHTPVDREPLYFSRAWQDWTRGAMKQGASGARPPQRRPAVGPTLKVAEEFTVTVETASPQTDVRKDRGWACTRASPGPGNEPCTRKRKPKTMFFTIKF